MHYVTFGSIPLINFPTKYPWYATDFLLDHGIIHRLIHEMWLKKNKIKKKHEAYSDKQRKSLIADLKDFDKSMRKLGY